MGEKLGQGALIIPPHPPLLTWFLSIMEDALLPPTVSRGRAPWSDQTWRVKRPQRQEYCRHCPPSVAVRCAWKCKVERSRHPCKENIVCESCIENSFLFLTFSKIDFGLCWPCGGVGNTRIPVVDPRFTLDTGKPRWFLQNTEVQTLKVLVLTTGTRALKHYLWCQLIEILCQLVDNGDIWSLSHTSIKTETKTYGTCKTRKWDLSVLQPLT